MSDVLTVKQAAEYLQINPQTISRKLQHGILPGRKVGKSYRIRREDLDEYLKGKPSTDEFSPEAQKALVAEVAAQVRASNPLELHPLPEGYQDAQDALWRALGYPGGYTWENWLHHINEHAQEHMRLLREAEQTLDPEVQALLQAGRLVESENGRLKVAHGFEIDELIRAALLARGFELVQPEDDLGVYTAAHVSGEGLLKPISKKAKEGLESANAGRRPRSRAE